MAVDCVPRVGAVAARAGAQRLRDGSLVIVVVIVAVMAVVPPPFVLAPALFAPLLLLPCAGLPVVLVVAGRGRDDDRLRRDDHGRRRIDRGGCDIDRHRHADADAHVDAGQGGLRRQCGGGQRAQRK
uniref:Transmembrane protein n=1 Tax=Ralstonia solanacearum CFBP2957 TaxID=859656 RepID=D8P3U1_RALSL|nr:protein of unknown function [Ralstonia solanacearum CFBP2957]